MTLKIKVLKDKSCYLSSPLGVQTCPMGIIGIPAAALHTYCSIIVTQSPNTHTMCQTRFFLSRRVHHHPHQITFAVSQRVFAERDSAARSEKELRNS